MVARVNNESAPTCQKTQRTEELAVNISLAIKINIPTSQTITCTFLIVFLQCNGELNITGNHCHTAGGGNFPQQVTHGGWS